MARETVRRIQILLERGVIVGKHTIQQRSWTRSAVMTGAVTAAAMCVALSAAGTAEAKTHHGPNAPGNPFSTPSGPLGVGAMQLSATTITRHSTTTTTLSAPQGHRPAVGPERAAADWAPSAVSTSGPEARPGPAPVHRDRRVGRSGRRAIRPGLRAASPGWPALRPVWPALRPVWEAVRAARPAVRVKTGSPSGAVSGISSEATTTPNSV